MNKEEFDLFKRLLSAAKAGECPNPTCKICKVKWDTIDEAEEYVKKHD